MGLTQKYILYHLHGSPDEQELNKIRSLDSIKILDHAFPQLVLIETQKETLGSLRQKFPAWKVGPLTEYESQA
ncbi:MAG: hypothetical protein AAFR61_14255 [Bacteroidota bacterium]